MRPATQPAGAPRQLRITTQAQAEYLALALLLTDEVLGRSRTPGLDTWVRDMRVTLLTVLPDESVRALLQRADGLALRIDAERGGP